MKDKELKRGISVCVSNAKELFRDAELLFEHKRFQRAYSLYQLASEEVGKALLIFNYFTSFKTEKIEKSKLLKELNQHKLKTEKIIAMDFFLVKSGADQKAKQGLIKYLYLREKTEDNLNDKKNYSLYTSIVNNEFKTPQELITNDEVFNFRTITSLRLALALKIVDIGIEHLEAVIEYIKTTDHQKILKDAVNDLVKELGKVDEDFINAVTAKEGQKGMQ